jgi:hypothetical protein
VLTIRTLDISFQMAISLSYHTHIYDETNGLLFVSFLFCLLEVSDIYSVLSQVPLLHLSKRNIHISNTNCNSKSRWVIDPPLFCHSCS